MDLDEFCDIGYLQEANRLFFHPLGLALAVAMDEQGRALRLHGIVDCRKDPSGVFFGESGTNAQAREKARAIRAERSRRLHERQRLSGTGCELLLGVEEIPAQGNTQP